MGQPGPQGSETDYIDLFQISGTLLKRWYLVLLCTMGAALIATAVVFILPPAFEATALVATSVSGGPGVALSDAVVAGTLSTLGETLPPDDRTPEHLRDHLVVTQDSGDIIARLSAEASKPQLAATIANAWAGQFVEVARELPVKDATGQALDLQTLMTLEETASARRNDSARALSEYRAQSRAPVWRIQLANLENSLSVELAVQESLGRAIVDGNGMMARLKGLPGTSRVPAAEQVALISLLQQSLSGNTGLSQAPVTRTDQATAAFQPGIVQVAPVNELMVFDATKYVQLLIASLVSTRSDASQEVDRLTSEILTVQSLIAESDATEEALFRENKSAEDKYAAVSTMVAPAEAASASSAKLVSQAEVPTEPASPKKARDIAIGTGLGFLIGLVLAPTFDWYQGRRRSDTQSLGEALEGSKKA